MKKPKRMGPFDRPTKHVPPTRTPRFSFGQTLRADTSRGDDGSPFVGRVDAIYADYWSCLGSGIVSPGWFEVQERPPSTPDQCFYSLVELDGIGAVVAGERECSEA